MKACHQQDTRPTATIKAAGGGGGQNIVESMGTADFADVERIVMNTDTRPGQPSPVRTVPLGEKLAGGRGTNGDREPGRQCAG